MGLPSKEDGSGGGGAPASALGPLPTETAPLEGSGDRAPLGLPRLPPWLLSLQGTATQRRT